MKGTQQYRRKDIKEKTVDRRWKPSRIDPKSTLLSSLHKTLKSASIFSFSSSFVYRCASCCRNTHLSQRTYSINWSSKYIAMEIASIEKYVVDIAGGEKAE